MTIIDKVPSGDHVMDPPMPAIRPSYVERRSTYVLRDVLWSIVCALALAVVFVSIHDAQQSGLIAQLLTEQEQLAASHTAYVAQTSHELGEIHGRQIKNEDRIQNLESGVCSAAAIEALRHHGRLPPYFLPEGKP